MKFLVARFCCIKINFENILKLREWCKREMVRRPRFIGEKITDYEALFEIDKNAEQIQQ